MESATTCSEPGLRGSSLGGSDNHDHRKNFLSKHNQHLETADEKLRGFFSLFKKAKVENKCLFQAYEGVFHPSLVSRVSPVVLDPTALVELTFHETFELVFRSHKKLRTNIELLSVRFFEDSVVFSVQYELMGHVLVATFRGEVCDNLIVLLRQEGTTFKVLENIKKINKAFDSRAFEETFDRDAAGLMFRLGGSSITNATDPDMREVLGYNEMYQNMRRAAFLIRAPMEITDFKPYPGGRMNYVVRGSYLGHDASFRCSVLTRDGKVVYLERDAARVEAVENLKAFLEMLGEGRQGFSHEAYLAAFERVFDEASTALVHEFGASVQDMTDHEKRVTLDTSQLFYRHFKPCASLAKLESVKPRFNGGIEFIMRVASHNGSELNIRYIGQTRNGRIFHLKQEETVVVKPEKWDVVPTQEKLGLQNDNDDNINANQENLPDGQQRRRTPGLIRSRYNSDEVGSGNSGPALSKGSSTSFGNRLFALKRIKNLSQKRQKTAAKAA